MLAGLIESWSLVKTDLGEGFLVGRSISLVTPNYEVRLLNGEICYGFTWPEGRLFREMELLDACPLNHPALPDGGREYLIKSGRRLTTNDAFSSAFPPFSVINGARSREEVARNLHRG